MPRESPEPSEPDHDSDGGMPLTAFSTTSTLLNHTIPPFYACYLLRSFNPRRGGTYIGSTPDPPRRYKQHSGEIKGGAFKTRLGRPWEMELVVHGFPTKLQALQFEWAWQNPHASRLLHSPPTPSPSGAALPPLVDTATARLASKPVAQFPRTAASNRPLTKLQVLQFMLTVPPWRSFNLSVTCFSNDAKSWWDQARKLGPVVRTEVGARKWERERIKEGRAHEDPWGLERSEWLGRVNVEVRIEGVDGKRLVRAGDRAEGEEEGRMRVDDDVFFENHWSKWTESASSTAVANCDICAQPIKLEDHLSFLLCTSSSSRCTAHFHLPCLASHFLSSPPSVPQPAAPLSTRAPPLLPTHGSCPACREPLHWSDLVRGSYRRKEEVDGSRKKRRFEKGTRAKELAALRGDDGDDEAGTTGLDTTGRRRIRKRANTKLVVASEDEASSDDDGAVASEEEEQERSWARSNAAEGALEDAGSSSPGESGDEPTASIFQKKKKPTKRGAVSPSPPPSSTTVMPTTMSRRRKRTPAAIATLTSTLGSTKSALTSAASTKKPPPSERPRAGRSPFVTPNSDDLPDPGTIGIGSTSKTKRNPKKVVEYIELSD